MCPSIPVSWFALLKASGEFLHIWDKVHSDWKMSWLDFYGQRSRSLKLHFFPWKRVVKQLVHWPEMMTVSGGSSLDSHVSAHSSNLDISQCTSLSTALHNLKLIEMVEFCDYSNNTRLCSSAFGRLCLFGCSVGWIIDQLAASRLLCYHRDGGWEPLSADVRRCCCWNMMGTGSERHWHRNGTEKRKTPPGWGECQAPRRRKLNPGFSSGKGWTAASELDLRHQEGTFAVICGCWGEG